MSLERPDSKRSRPLTPAEAEIVEKNQRLAWWTANRIFRRLSPSHPLYGTEGLFDDLLDATLIGLTYAAKTFDPAIGRFSTYAVEVMQGECRRFLRRRQVKLPPSHLSFVSLQDPLPGEDSSGDAYAEFISDPNAANPESEAMRRALPGLLDAAIQRLPEKDAEVIRRRFLGGENLDSVGAAIGRTRQRAHQIERRALIRLRQYLTEQGFATAGDLMR